MTLTIQPDISSTCAALQEQYSACDISDALLKLHIPAAGFLPDIAPIRDDSRRTLRLVAPISTAILVPKAWTNPTDFPPHLPHESNIPFGQNWTDTPRDGTVVVVQQPRHHISAILGDIMVTRLQKRQVLGVVADGRIRDVKSCKEICKDTNFQVWAKGVSAAGPSLEAKPWAVDIPLQIGDVWIRPGDILCADEEDTAIVVIPQSRLGDVVELLPVLKEASQRVLKDVSNGLSLVQAVQRSPNFYSNYK